MKIKLIIIIASMLVGSSSAQLAHPNEQKLDHSNVNIALAQSGSEANSLALLRPLHAASGSNSPNLTAEEERTVRIISCFAVMYGNEKELLKSADLVVKGHVVEELESTFVRGKYSEYTTDKRIQIDKVYKGELAEGDEIIVTQLGGYDGEVTVIYESTTFLKEQQEAVLFLRISRDGKYRAITEHEGVYVLEDGFYINKGNNKVLNGEFLEQ